MEEVSGTPSVPGVGDFAGVRLRAELRPLDGRKYYGSEIALYDGKDHIESFTIWVMGDYSPSERELAEWDEDEYGPWEGDSSHYESALGYHICQIIVGAINV